MQNQTKTKKKRVKGDPIYLWWIYPLLVLITIVVTFLLAFLPLSKIARDGEFNIYQVKDNTPFYDERVIDLFDDYILNDDKLIHPLINGVYTFTVNNQADAANLIYSLELTGFNPDNIPLVISLQKNGAYIQGGESNEDMMPLSSIFLNEEKLLVNMNDIYTLKWRWATIADELDTEYGNYPQNLSYTVKIKVNGYKYEDVSSGLSVAQRYYLYLWIWVFFWLVVLAINIVILVFKLRRKKEGVIEQAQTDIKDN